MDKYQILKKYFGYDSFREGQELMIDHILNGGDVLGIMPTGAGKSLCYQVPSLLLPGITLVISPLISLMKDQVQALNQSGIHAAFINSSLSEVQIKKALKLAMSGQYKIIYVAPERLETYEFMEFAMSTEISMVTVDEAHCISQWGQDFRPSYVKIVQVINRLPKRPIVSAFTATATETVKEDILCVLGLYNPKVLVTGFDRKNLYFAVEKPAKKDAYVFQYVQNHMGESGIIYCATRKNVESVYEMLRGNDISVTRYHAGLSNEERKINQDDFIYDQKQLVVATNAFGMGIDKSNVRFVIHYNMPQSLENYYQEAGRAGRDGEPAECILLYSPQDIMVNRFLLESKEGHLEYNEDLNSIRERDEIRLQSMSYYCLTTNCLREYILRYFGERDTRECGNCSSCMREYEELDMTKAAQKIISCVLESGQRYGINVICGILCGNNTAKLREYGVLSQISYGSIKEMRETNIKQLINHMVLENILTISNDKYALIKIGPKANEVYEGRQVVILKAPKEQPIEASSVPGKTPVKQRKSDVLNSKGLELFDKLRELRVIIAREESLPPYIIFSDKTLVDMCIKCPLSREDILTVSGVGENKYQKYGQRFLDKIMNFTGGERQKYYFGDSEEIIFGEYKKPKNLRTKTVKQEFYITSEIESKIIYSESCLISQVVNQLNELRNPDQMKRISGAELTRWLTDQGYIAEKYEDGKNKKIVQNTGAELDIKVGMRVSAKGSEYEDFYYGEKAQRMLIKHLLK